MDSSGTTEPTRVRLIIKWREGEGTGMAAERKPCVRSHSRWESSGQFGTPAVGVEVPRLS